MDIYKAWKYIEEWLLTETKDYNCDALAEGAKEDELQLFQGDFSIKLPNDFYSSYLLHNGFEESIGLVHAGDLLSISKIKRLYSHLIDRENTIKWDSNIFPFVEFNETDFLSIDFRDNQVYWTGINEDGSVDTKKTAFASFSDFLFGLVNDLRDGNGIMGEMLC
jgi:cell wall assembly regulator SMI1